MSHYSIYSRMQRNILHCMRKEILLVAPELNKETVRNGSQLEMTR